MCKYISSCRCFISDSLMHLSPFIRVIHRDSTELSNRCYKSFFYLSVYRCRCYRKMKAKVSRVTICPWNHELHAFYLKKIHMIWMHWEISMYKMVNGDCNLINTTFDFNLLIWSWKSLKKKFGTVLFTMHVNDKNSIKRE